MFFLTLNNKIKSGSEDTSTRVNLKRCNSRRPKNQDKFSNTAIDKEGAQIFKQALSDLVSVKKAKK